MQATFVELRKRSAEIIRALMRNESVAVLYRGKPAAVMHPINANGNDPATHAKQETPTAQSVADRPAFGLWADRDDMADPTEFVRRTRRSRFDGAKR